MMRTVRRGLLVAAVTAATAAPAYGSDRIEVRDACDPLSFNAALGPDACVRDDDSGRRVTFDELLAGFPAGHDAWRFSDDVTVRRGRAVPVEFDRGGELHSVTEVDHLGPGCVDQVNALMGLEGAPVADCGAVFGDPAQLVLPGARRTRIAGLAPGKHLFMCVIHPWMHTTVTVR